MSHVTNLEVPVNDVSIVTVGHGIKNLTELTPRIALCQTTVACDDICTDSDVVTYCTVTSYSIEPSSYITNQQLTLLKHGPALSSNKVTYQFREYSNSQLLSDMKDQ